MTKTNNVKQIKEDPEAGVLSQLKDSMGRFRTLSLFKEHKHDSYPAFFTLKDYDVDNYVSFKRKYLEISDPTEYQVAMKMLGSWKHWELLISTQWFKPLVESWREELAVKLESQRYHEMTKVLETSDPNSPQALQATKWLAERYEKKDRKRGRPSKDEIKNRLKKEAEDSLSLEEDAKTLGITP